MDALMNVLFEYRALVPVAIVISLVVGLAYVMSDLMEQIYKGDEW